MKKVLTLILSIVIFGSWGQKMEFKWNEAKTISIPEGDFYVLTLEGAEYTATNFYLPQIQKTISGKKIKHIEVTAATYENCNLLESKLIDPSFQNTEIVFNINSYVILIFSIGRRCSVGLPANSQIMASNIPI